MTLSEQELLRYNRQTLLPELGDAGQAKLKNAKVLVIGCGGLGSPILLYLAAAGIGTLGFVDADKVEESNLQRQVLYSQNTLGKPKVEVAAKRLTALNPYLRIVQYQLRLSAANALEIFESYDLIIDGSDNFPTRYLINDACVLLQKPFIYGAVYCFEGQVAVFNYKNSATYRDLFPEPPPLDMAPNCSEIGVLGVLTGIIGCLQATEAIKLICNIGELLVDKMMLFDALTMHSRIIKIAKNENKPIITHLIDYDAFCDRAIPNEILWEDFLTLKEQKQAFQLIDVRETAEYLSGNIAGESIPLSVIEANIEKIAKEIPVIVCCQTGQRSIKAIRLLETKYGFDNLINLKGGISVSVE